MLGSVRASDSFACILELAMPEEEIPKHVRSTQFQFKMFKRELFHVIAQALFRQCRDVVVL